MDADPDLPLVRALQAGEGTALDELMARHRQGVFRFALHRLHDEEDAREVALETFTRAYFAIDRFRPSAKFVTWLYRIALNLCRDRRRRSSERLRGASVPLEAVPEEALRSGRPILGAPDEETDRRARVAALEGAIARLPRKLREALTLTALDGFSHEEAGRLLRVSAKTVEMRVRRARLALRRCLDPKE